MHALPAELQARCEVTESTARTGGGTMPKSEIPSITITITPESISVNQMSKKLRTGTPALVGTVDDGKLHLDLRTVFPHQDAALIERVSTVC